MNEKMIFTIYCLVNGENGTTATETAPPAGLVKDLPDFCCLPGTLWLSGNPSHSNTDASCL